MRVLVTRPLPDAETTAADLRRRGHEPVLAPMLDVRFADWADIPDHLVKRRPDALIATSLNGIRGLVGHPNIGELKRQPLFVVGDASAHLAQSHGFSDVRSAKGDVKALVELIAHDLPAISSLLYASGHDPSVQLIGNSYPIPHTIYSVEVYRAIAVTALPDPVIAQLTAGEIDRILIFSGRTAEAFITSMKRANLLRTCRDIPIHVISQQASASHLRGYFRSVVVAPRPDAAELLDTLDTSRSPVSDTLHAQGDPHDSQ